MKLFTVFCITLLAFTSISCTSQSTDDLRLSDSEYTDPKGFFSIIPPEGWRVQGYPDDPRGKIALFGPSSVELRVLTNNVDFSSVEGIVSHAKAMEQKLGIETNIMKSTFNGFPAIERTFLYKGDRYWYVDFLVGNISHNLAYSASKKRYEEYLGIAKLSLSTYEPHYKKLTKKEEDDNYLAKMRRVGKLLTEQGSYTMAIKYIEQGLATSPTDPELLDLKNKIVENRKLPNKAN